jgi:hypothetical protein
MFADSEVNIAEELRLLYGRIRPKSASVPDRPGPAGKAREE